MSRQTPAITVIVPVWNVAAEVGAAIDSLRAQLFIDFEALVIDDGSTDGSGQIAQAAAAGDGRFRLIRQENAGLSAARNRGLDAAQGAFVSFLDGDDALDPAFLAELHTALTREGADWAACGLALCYPDGAKIPHPALHHAEGAEPAGDCLHLKDACDAARVFPSAWNKLYRRGAICDLRFPHGLWFEDHVFFWAVAARSPRLAYIPAPLYHHRRDRPAQITSSDSERVFEQFTVLDKVRMLINAGGFARKDEGFARLATRLLHERALVIKNRPRRARFIAAAAEAFARWGISFSPAGDPSISLGFGVAMGGELPLSVVLLNDPSDPSAVTRRLDALQAQSMADFDVHLLQTGAEVAVCPEGLEVTRHASPDALLEALRGRYVMIFAADERLMPEALMQLVNLALREGADLVVGGFMRDTKGYHDGWTDNRLVSGHAGGSLSPAQVLRLYPALGNRIIHRALITRDILQHLADGSAARLQAFVFETALAAMHVVITDQPVAHMPDQPHALSGLTGMRDALQALNRGNLAALPEGWRGVVFLRLTGLQPRPSAWRWLWALALLVSAGLWPADAATQPDPETPRWLRACLRRWPWRRG
ncbi:glycosyltransferase family 2 protein [Pararhodobacter oceanensis]|uniref:glycosyltransferase family 2 protein n=1 Tax=Pararhodobacter oceanensis TaxID=2172121 RepID=UPI003A90D97D